MSESLITQILSLLIYPKVPALSRRNLKCDTVIESASVFCRPIKVAFAVLKQSAIRRVPVAFPSGEIVQDGLLARAAQLVHGSFVGSSAIERRAENISWESRISPSGQLPSEVPQRKL